MELFLFLVFNGIITGLITALIALGLALVFGIMRIINMAHGDLYMLGAAGAVMLESSGVPFWVSFVLLPLAFGVLALPFESYVLRSLEGSVLATLVATIGLSFILQQLALIIFGGEPRRLEAPIAFDVQIL